MENNISKAFEICQNALSKFDPDMDLNEKLDDLKIVWNTRLTTTAGRAKGKSLTIELNKDLLTDNPKEFESTVLHELCHILDYVIHGRMNGHRYQWKNLMLKVGAEPERCHTMHCKKSKKHPIVAQAKCECKTFSIKPIRYKKMIQGTTYTCRNCKNRLVLI